MEWLKRKLDCYWERHRTNGNLRECHKSGLTSMPTERPERKTANVALLNVDWDCQCLVVAHLKWLLL